MKTTRPPCSSLFVLGSLFDPYVLVSYCKYDLCIFSDFDRSQNFISLLQSKLVRFNFYSSGIPLRFLGSENVALNEVCPPRSLPLFGRTTQHLRSVHEDVDTVLRPSWAKKIFFSYGGMKIVAHSIAHNPISTYNSIYQHGRKAPNILVKNDLPSSASTLPSPSTIWDMYENHANNNGYQLAEKIIQASKVWVG